MPEFDDELQPPHFRSQLDYNPLPAIERYTVLLKDGETTATIYPLQSTDALPPGLLAFLCDEFNIEIERGDTFSFFDTLHVELFQNYWFGAFAGVMVLGDAPTLEGPKHWEKECLGTFFVKPNYPGRASHICTAGFLVNAGIRGKGIGRTLTDCFLQWAPRLGYTYCVFNLVFETNVPARRIWESLNFKRIGRIKAAGILKGHDMAVDAIIYGRELVALTDSSLGAYRFDKIKFYLETGKYPPMADRQEKSRLRSLASHYRLGNGKLMLRDKEVVSDPVRQLHICTEVHLLNHGGINKTTSTVAEKYHWTRIKDTVSAAIKNCVKCQESAKEEIVMKRVGPMRKRPMKPSPTKPLRRKALPSLREIIKRDRAHDVDGMGVLHHIPGRDGENLLLHDLLSIDDGLIAAVEAAHKLHSPPGDSGALRLASHRSDEPTGPTYAAVAAAAAAANSHEYYQNDYPYKYKRDESREGSDNASGSGYDHEAHSRENEIEIARALMHSNEVDEPGTDAPEKNQERQVDANIFLS